MKKMKRLIPIILILILMSTPVYADDLQEGWDAYYQGEYKLALGKWKPIAELGDALVQFTLGTMYSEGKGVTQNYQEAIKWYRLAAEQGNAEAQYNLGWVYANGDGVKQDYKEAGKWWRLATAKGDSLAPFYLGGMYADGEGVSQDYIQASKWFIVAGANGNKKGYQYRDIIKKEMTSEQISEAQKLAKEWMKEHGITVAQAELPSERESPKKTGSTHAATPEPAPKTTIGKNEMAKLQTAQVDKSPAERLQEEIEIVSKVISSSQKQEKENAEPIKPNPVKATPVHENAQVAKLEPKMKQKTLHEELDEGNVCVHSKRANLRNGPGTKYKKLAQVKIYTPLERLKRAGQWVQVRDFQGETFWVYKTLITENYVCGTVVQDKTDFYSQPDFNSFPFYGAPMEPGFSVRILSLNFRNDWAKVVDSAGNILWVQKSMLWIR